MSEEKKKRVFILGAGVSAEFGLPLGVDLTTPFLEELKNRGRQDLSGFFDDRLRFYFPKYEKRKSPVPSLFKLSSALLSGEKFYAYLYPEKMAEGGTGDWKAYFSVLKKYLTTYFRKRMEELKSANDIQLMVNFCKLLKPGDVVISFNWDCLLEMALERSGVQWNTFLWEDRDAKDLEWSTDHVLLLKLHGSIDWIRKPHHIPHEEYSYKWVKAISDEANWYRLRCYRDKITFEEGDIPEIHVPGEELLSEDLRSIWRLALSILRTADEITIIGYSLPAYDFYTRNLFLLSQRAKEPADLLQSIKVINRDLGPKRSYEEVLNDEIEYLNIRFSLWIKNQIELHTMKFLSK